MMDVMHDAPFRREGRERVDAYAVLRVERSSPGCQALAGTFR